MKIQLTIEVKRPAKEAADFSENLAEHIRITFNDDESIGAIWWKLLPRQGERI